MDIGHQSHHGLEALPLGPHVIRKPESAKVLFQRKYKNVAVLDIVDSFQSFLDVSLITSFV